MVNRVLFQIGAILVIFSLFIWLVFSFNDVLDIPLKELTVGVIIGGLLMLPELHYQLRQFFSSRSMLDD